jgi:predicted CopG family antitoxin
MDDKKQVEIMSATVNSIKELLEKRLSNRLDALEAISTTSLDNVPESIQKMREEEASKTRAVIQEQRDILDIIKSLFPNT